MEKTSNILLNESLTEAIKSKDVSEVIKLIELGADPYSGKYPPMLWGFANFEEFSPEITKLLFKRNPNVDIKWIAAAYFKASQENDFEFLQWVREFWPELDFNQFRSSALYEATRPEDISDKDLIKTEYDKRFVRNKKLNTKLIEILLKHGLSPSKQIELESAVFNALISFDEELLNMLLEYPCDLNNNSVILGANWCAYHGKSRLLKLLVDNGFNVTPKVSKRRRMVSPLNYAIAGGDLESIKVIAKNEKNFNYIPNYYPLTYLFQHTNYLYHPMHLAIELEFKDAVEIMLDSGFSVNGDPTIFHPVVMSVARENVDILKLFLEAGADVNGYVAKSDYSNLEGEADAIIYNLLDHTAMDLVKRFDVSTEIIQLLSKYGAKRKCEI